MKCPVCSEPDLLMSERQGIEIDYCPKCRGVWLDRGELDKLIDRSATAQPPETYQPPPEHGRREHYDDRRPHRKKRSLLGDIFDFD